MPNRDIRTISCSSTKPPSLGFESCGNIRRLQNYITRPHFEKKPNIYLEKLNSVNENAEISYEKCKKRAFTYK